MILFIKPGDPVNSNRYVPILHMRQQLPPPEIEDPGLWTLAEGEYDGNQYFDKQTKRVFPYPEKENMLQVFDYEELKWVDAILSRADAFDALRNKRTVLLKQSDWVVVRAQERNEPVPEDWCTYREALRMITEQPGAPYNVVWPTAPEA